MSGSNGRYLLDSVSPCVIFNYTLATLWISAVWDMYLSFRQWSVVESTKKVPEELDLVMDDSRLQKAKNYSLKKFRFSLTKMIVALMLETALLWFNAVKHVWSMSENIVQAITGWTMPASECATTATFLVISLKLGEIVSLAWSLYYNFVIEEEFGFNKQTIGFFLKDQLKKFVILNGAIVIILTIVVKLIITMGDSFIPYTFGFIMTCILAIILLYPDFIAPMFDKFTPLPDCELKKSITDLAEKVNFPGYKVFVVEGSVRSSHSNAYFVGFFKTKRIVLFDTLVSHLIPNNKPKKNEEANDKNLDMTQLETDKASRGDDDKLMEKQICETVENDNKTKCTPDEIISILAHELGHWSNMHTYKILVFALFELLVQLWCFSLFYKSPSVYAAFGFEKVKGPTIVGLMFCIGLISPITDFYNVLMSMLSRRYEREADQFAVDLDVAENLVECLKKLEVDNLSFPVYDWLYSTCKFSHPPLIERLRFIIQSMESKKQKQQ